MPDICANNAEGWPKKKSTFADLSNCDMRFTVFLCKGLQENIIAGISERECLTGVSNKPVF